MNQDESFFSIKRIGPATAAAVLAACATYAAFFDPPNLLYACGEEECLSILFARGYFSSIAEGLLPPNALPIQQINLPIALAAKASDWIGARSEVLCWLAVSLLGMVFLLRSQRFYSAEEGQTERLIFFGLLALHPFFWSQLWTAPGQMLIAWLTIEFLVCYRRRGEIGAAGGAALFAMSLTGGQGFVWAALLAGTAPLVQAFSTPEKNGRFWPKMGLSLAPILPMGLVYLFLTLQFGQAGGMRLAGHAGWFATLRPIHLLSGEWTHYAKDWLIWCADGFAPLPAPMPLLGILALIGGIAAWEKAGRDLFLPRCAGVLWGLSFLLLPFLLENARPASTPLLPLVLFLGLRGVRRISECWHAPHWILTAVLGALLAFTQAAGVPRQWSGIADRARYYQNLHETLENEIDPLLSQIEDTAAVRFDPMVFCRLEQAERVYPAGLSLECPFTCEYGKRGGIYFDLRFAPAPATVILHPRYEEIRDSNSTPECLMHAQTRLALESHYRSTPAFNFTVFHRESRRRDILYDWLWSAYDDGCDFEAQRLPGWFADRFDAASNPGWELDDEAIHKPAGAAWTFEAGFDRTQQIGLAFGSQPTSAQRGAGVFSAESGNRITAGRMGILKSEPFILEGDDLRFYANLPQDSTATFFCLAVYEEVPFGGESPIQQARHLFERKTGESLAGDAFFYVQPQHLSYLPERIRGWHVVRALQTSEKPGWRRYRWSVDPWKDKQAIWLAADRDPRHAMAVDQIIQWKRAPGFYANFEKGGYEDWTYVGKAFGDRPATGPIGDQTTIHGLEGNYFINTYYQGSDAATGTLMSPRFELTGDQMEFRIGGGADLERLYVGLRIDDRLVRRATGDNSETMRLVQWDVSPWVGKIVRIEIADLSSDLWGHILADDFRIHPSLRLKIQTK